MADDANLLKRRARRRLVGAIALVVLVVVVLPIILDQKPRPTPQELTVQIPSQDGGPFKTRVLPPLQPAPAAPQKSEAPQIVAETPVAPAEPVARPAPAKKESAKVSEKPRAKAKTAEAFVFQLGVFSNPDNAKQVRDRAASAGIKSYTEQVKGQQGEQTRVRAGPFSSRGAAEKARDKLKTLGMDVGQVGQR
ncbi:MAG TPA: SPOR domain-containing protein [Burkholderiales bacterium]|nr:SPOR domain-containing protein [Burkholderiales bacterium]